LNRPIRSYVLRQGRTTAAQSRALEELFPKHGLPFSRRPIAPREVFGRAAPLVLEIGSGMGETTAQIAKARPDVDFLAVEVHGPGVGSLLNRIEAFGLTNLRVVRHDALEVLEHMVPDASLSAIHVFFPDPWPKKRHHKRRLVQAGFTGLAARKLRPGGIVHMATDWPEYGEQISEVFGREALFEPAPSGYCERALTKFEARGMRLGHPIRDLFFRRRESAPAAR
jgi:tRNA (guanine-N7-)-methyltransferase